VNWRRWLLAGVAVLAACTSSEDVRETSVPATGSSAAVTTTVDASLPTAPGTTPAPPSSTSIAPRNRPLPPPVVVRQQSDVPLADPTFTALPGATAEFGTLGGAAYQIEVPNDWNGQLVLWMHGYEELGPQAHVGPPDFRRYLIANGFAWGASSFSSTLLIPGRAADETAALWDYFVSVHRRPERTYVSGFSMGGWATHIAAERYGDRFDGALGLCGAAGNLSASSISANVFVAAAYVAGVTQPEFDAAPNVGELLTQRITPILEDPAKRAEFEQLVVDLTGGARRFGIEGVQLEETKNLERAELGINAGVLPTRDGPYRLAEGSAFDSDEFNRLALRLPNNPEAFESFWEGTEVTGDLQIPLLTMHTTGDGQVPIDQAQILRTRVAAAGRADLLVQRVIEDPGHCGFTTGEDENAFDALVQWVQTGRRPEGTNLDTSDLAHLDRTFELQPRLETGVAGGRVVVSGGATLDGAPLDTRFLGAVVRDRHLITPCQLDIPPVVGGQFEITVLSNEDSAGCGRAGAEIIPWIYVGNVQVFATTAIPWPPIGRADAEFDFSSSDPIGAATPTIGFFGEVYLSSGKHAPAGSRVEAFIGDALCGVGSIRDSGSFSGYLLGVVGPDAIAACREGATVTFRVDGLPVNETARNAPRANDADALDLTLP
jgi:pimeloyl-ACP methyl ester carboxylesterase